MRIESLQKRIITAGLDGGLLFYSRDIFYYTGTAQPAWLAVRPDDYFLFIRSGFNFASQEVCIEQTKMGQERKIEKIFANFFQTSKKIGIQMDILPANQYLKIKQIFKQGEFTDISPLILEQRKIKEPQEVKKIKQACQAVHAGHEAVLEALTAGITELELAAAIENAQRLAGHEGAFFSGCRIFSCPEARSHPGLIFLKLAEYSIH